MPNFKQLTANPRIRTIFQKHLTALSNDLAQELTQPLLADWGLTRADVGLPAEGTRETPPSLPMQLIYDGVSRRWTCPRCRTFSSLQRRSVTTHLRFCDAVPSPVLSPPRKNASRKSRSTKKKP